MPLPLCRPFLTTRPRPTAFDALTKTSHRPRYSRINVASFKRRRLSRRILIVLAHVSQLFIGDAISFLVTSPLASYVPRVCLFLHAELRHHAVARCAIKNTENVYFFTREYFRPNWRKSIHLVPLHTCIRVSGSVVTLRESFYEQLALHIPRTNKKDAIVQTD